MWPLILDMTKDESLQSLRNLELEAYSHLVSALRAQGPLSTGKRQLLRETSAVLNISQERHKAEIRRALTDEKLTTIAYHVNAQHEYNNEWAQEGRRVIPLLPRMAAPTALSAVADELSESADQKNKLLPLPATTERKLSLIQNNQNTTMDCIKSNLCRTSEQIKPEEFRKRKFSENSSLAHHLLGPCNKLSRIQQIYRQKTKSAIKEEVTNKVRMEQEQQTIIPYKTAQLVLNQKSQSTRIPKSMNSPSGKETKINILQNINIKQPSSVTSEGQMEQHQDINNTNSNEFNESNQILTAANINENINNRMKFVTKNNNVTFKSSNTLSGANLNLNSQKNLKINSSKKTNTKTVPTTSQKLIVVSNAQALPTTSILQKTLTIPFMKNISVKNFDKFKIVTSSGTPVTLANTTVNSINLNSVKHKVVTVRTSNSVSAGKKVLPLTQLQMLNQGSIKVLPLGGKIIGTTANSPILSSMYIVNSTQNKTINTLPIVTSTKVLENDGNIQEALLNSEASTFNFSKNSEKMQDEFHIQSVTVTSEEAVVDVHSEEIKFSEVGQATEQDKSAMLYISELDCISDGEIVAESRICLGSMEKELKGCADGNNTIEDFSEHFSSAGHGQESEKTVYLEN